MVDALWVRDLPVVPSDDADVGQFDDPFAYLARLGPTGSATVGTASVILGVRHPLVVARAAAAAQAVSGGRFVLGVGSGGKPAMNDALGVGDRSPRRFAERWFALRDAVCGRLAPGVMLPGAGDPPRMYLASARRSHWAAIGGDADGWLAFLEPWADLDRTLATIGATRGGRPPPIAVRIDLTLADGPPALGERGRLRCRPADLTTVFRRLQAYPLEHLMIRLAGADPCRDLAEVRRRWETSGS